MGLVPCRNVFHVMGPVLLLHEVHEVKHCWVDVHDGDQSYPSFRALAPVFVVFDFAT